MTLPFADPIVDWGTLGKVVVAALVSGIGVTAFFSLAILGATRSVEMRRNRRSTEANAYVLLGLVGIVVSVAAIVFGIIVMTTK